MYIFLKNAAKKEIPLGSCLILGSFAFFVIKKFELFNHLLVL